MMEKFTNSSKAQNNGRPQWLYSIVLMCLMIMFGATNAYAQPPYSGGGFGTESSPYLLSTKADLTNFFNDVFVSGIYEENNSKKYFRMTKDINMENSIIYYLSNGNDPKMMANIVFDGGGYTISNVRNSYTYKEYHYYRGGLFPSIDDSWIKNLTVSNFEFHGNIGLGGLVGIVLTTQESSIIENCHVKNGTLYGHSYSSEYDDTLGAQDIGGLVGYVASLPQSPVAQFEGCSVSNDVKIIFCEKNNNTAQTTHGKNAGGLIGHCFLANITINDCLIGTDLKSNVGAGHTSIGGLIGLNSQCTIHIARVVLPIDNVTPHETNWRGRIIGANAGTVTTSMIYVSNTNMPVGAGDPLSSYPRTYSTLNNAGEVYTNLERTDLYGGVIAAAADGNKCWGYGSVANLVTDGPILTKQNYLVKLTKETSVYTITGNGVKYYSNNNYYSLANYPVIVTANAWPSDNRQLNFYINDEIVYTIQGNSSPRTYDGHTPIKDGIFKTTSVYIPYPESGLSGTFDQWNNIITLKWTSNNGDKIQGKWYIYKRLNNTTGAWSRTEGPDAVLSFHNYQHPVSTTSTDWDKTWDYAISFFPDGEDILNVPHPYNSKTITVAATTNISITNFKAVGQTNKIVISANVPTQLTNSTLYKYSIYRKADEGSFNAIQTDRRFDGTGKIEYIDEGISSPCITYTYYIEITAFNRNFKSNNVSASSTGSTVLTSLTATKGEYTDHVRLEWTTNKTTTQNSDRYKIFRAVVTNANPNPTWTELATINTNDISYVYTDDRAMPGIYYRYKVAIYQVCSDEIIEMNQLSDLGFAQSLGDVSGRVTYGSGISVKDVSISAIRNDLQQNESQYHSLKCTTATNGKYFYWTPTASYYNDIINGNFTYQFWLNPNANMTGETKIAEIGNLLNIFLVRSGGRYLIHLKTTSGTTVLTTTDGILPSRFTHVSIVRNGNNFTCYIANDENLDNIQLKTSSSSYTFGTITATTNMGIRMGYSFVGYIDECRFWSRALSANEIRKDFNRILVGNEDNLRAYWTFDEGIDSYYTEAGYFFDISCVGTMFNRNHGRHNLICDTTIPTADQLGLKAFTDSNGNYQIRGIPFSGSSSSYDIVPTLGVHTFNPSSHLRIIGNNSLVHNGVDFTDISSFNVSGTVVYKDGDYPVTGCNFEVDGAIQTNSDGSAVTNNDDGSFSISVPIGEHTVRVVKTGHVFENNGYLTMPEGGYNKHESGKMFYDKTRVKLIGRVVGGLTEHNKPLAFGESVNNTGASTVKLTATLSNYNLQNNSHSETFKHNEGQWQKPNSRPDDSTLVTYNKKDITITISPETGEFVAWVYPEVYTIGKITAQNYNEDIYNKNEILDLSQAAVPNDDMLKTSIRTWQDSVLVQRPGQIDYYEHFENSDTVRYHADWAIYYQAVPTFNVSQLSGQTPVPYFGETEYHLEDALTGESEDIVLWDENTGYLFDAPVFIQGNRYTFGFEAREQYINHVNNGTIYMYPINEGTVTLTNTVALNSSSNIELDETGKATHTFMAGAPDLTTGKHSFLGTIKIGAAEYYWDYGITAMEVWHLGDKTTGTDFMTAGPNEITTILRDPPGSLSYSYIETGTTITTNSSSEVKNGMQEVMNLTTTLGPLVKTFIGLGGGVILESEVTFDTSLGIHTEQTWISSTETSNSVTFVESFETSDDPLYVGHLGDIFIGNST
ncbi:LamG domain-containing protein, partial [Bacteroidales bacterium OttesenSCG-928-L14]|nr:LamG domain-containing protein [Bacteroidales bacterium OttesenSCG-928-L14]